MELAAEKAAETAAPAPAEVKPIELPEIISVKTLAELLQVSGIDVIKQLMRNGMMANITQTIDYEAAAAVAPGFGFQPKKTQARRKGLSVISEIKLQQMELGKEAGNLKPRPPVVTVM